ncbi:LOW QUALITY PROTEIN: hypothetical protein HID58_050710 [Brassica napus]|uniref:Uncharacterized protein n=1 Tax=Brassica napus TaxID=3708 RepID=A0ABQ8A702_BRANA|nr:LOW QUALITY PROTEIN: hypothetical protein HID58_050710 [Brassica napus]
MLCFDMREICVLWNVEECPNWDKRFQGAVNAFLAYTDTQPSPELMDGMPTFLTKGDKDTIANTIVHHILIWARKNPEPSVSTLMLISDNLSEETLTACLALKRKWTILTSELIRLKALLEETISNKEREILVLKREVKELEMIVERLKADLEAAKTARVLCKRALLKSGSEVTDLKEKISVAEEELSKKDENEIETVKEEKNQALKKEQDATCSVQMLLEDSNEEEEKSNKSMEESLASALHESEARKLKEKLLSQGDEEEEDYETQVEDLKLAIKATSYKYEKMLEDARHEIDVLLIYMCGGANQVRELESSVEMREAGLVNHVKKFDEEVSSMKMNRLGNLVKRTKEEADAAWKKESEMRDGFKLIEKMLDKETEFQSLVHENDFLRVKQDHLLEEALAKKDTEGKDRGELSESEKDYDLLPNVVEFSEERIVVGHRRRSAEEKKEAFHKRRPEQEDPKEEVEDANMIH